MIEKIIISVKVAPRRFGVTLTNQIKSACDCVRLLRLYKWLKLGATVAVISERHRQKVSSQILISFLKFT